MDRKPVSVKSYANIAIVKYWGKADADRMIPSTSSISLTLENMYTETKLSFLPKDATSDVMYIGDELQGEKETTKASKVLDIFRTDPNQPVKIETWNNMPTAAGLSSSSSGLSALVKAANELFQVGKRSLNWLRLPSLLQAHHHVLSLGRWQLGIRIVVRFIQLKQISNWP